MTRPHAYFNYREAYVRAIPENHPIFKNGGDLIKHAKAIMAGNPDIFQNDKAYNEYENEVWGSYEDEKDL